MYVTRRPTRPRSHQLFSCLSANRKNTITHLGISYYCCFKAILTQYHSYFTFHVSIQKTLTLIKDCSKEIKALSLFLIKWSFQQISQMHTTAITNTPPSPGPRFGMVELCPVLPDVLFPTLALSVFSPLALVLVVELWEADWGAQGFGNGSLFSVRDGWLSPPDDALLTKEANGLPPNYKGRKSKHVSSTKANCF